MVHTLQPQFPYSSFNNEGNQEDLWWYAACHCCCAVAGDAHAMRLSHNSPNRCFSNPNAGCDLFMSLILTRTQIKSRAHF
jgi:hypothetical protein